MATTLRDSPTTQPDTTCNTSGIPARPDSEPSVNTLPAISDRPVRLGVLISGGGRTLLNLVDEIQSGQLNAEIPIVIASPPDCPGVERSREAGLTCQTISKDDFSSAETLSDEIFSQCRTHEVDLVIMAGFLCLIHIPDDFEHRVLNIHPSLIPAFCGRGYYGSRVHEAAIARGTRISGCTVHFADNEYDHGPIVIQRPVEVPDGTSPDELAAMVFEQEQIAYPEAIRRVISGQLQIDGQRTAWKQD